jgi:hypothetical protein
MTSSARHPQRIRVRALPVIAAISCLVPLLLAGCQPSIGTINSKPDHYYGKDVRLSGHIGEILVRNENSNPQVFHLISSDEHRIIVVASAPLEARRGDWVRVRGRFTPQHMVDGRTFYDVISATTVQRGRTPLRIPFL